MKKFRLSFILTTVFVLSSLSMSAQKGTDEAVKNLKAYDKVQMGQDMERYVLYVDPKADEFQFGVELVAGKTMEVDCNRHNLLGKFTQHTVEGWGFSYYVFETKGEVVSTMMACLDAVKTEKLVTSGEGYKVRYNSRLPIVVYLPKGYTLKYKIWSAGEDLDVTKQ